jgi:4,5-DOPA dioxygenase extradiol
VSSIPRLPAIFVGHGNPMNALAQNEYTRAWRSMGASIPKPRAVLAISAHWYVPYTAVTAMSTPRTIHDFGGFPRELSEFQYPAPGSPEVAAEVRDVIGASVQLDQSWGLDHGSWGVLCHVFPEADVPVIQLSINRTLAPRDHYQLGRALAPLRERGILIVASGNLIHNLREYAWGEEGVEPYDWALRFETQAKSAMLAGDHQTLIEYETLGRDALLAAPTPEHYLPLLYALGAQSAGDAVNFPVEGIDGGSISMLSVRVG